FPENAEMDSGGFYERNKDQFESLSFVDYSREENYNYTYDVMYSPYGEKDIDINLESLSTKVGYSGDYQKIDDENTRIYLAEEQQLFEEDDRKRTVYRFFSYIVPKGGNVGIEYIYSFHCFNEKECKIDPKKEKEKALMLMKSVEFIKNE
ncbi:hypothetical protein, partial [Aquibacillus rhizosphaerae]